MMPTATKRKNLFILAFTLVVVMLGYGLVIPIIPFYVESMGAGGFELGLLVASYALMRLIFGPIWGSLSDRIGRKPVLMLGVLGYAITMFLFGLATQLWMLFAVRVLSGILSSATAPTTMAYVGDSTVKEERGGGMGVLGAAVGLGTVLGTGLGGWLSGDGALQRPFFIAAAFSLLAVILIYLFLPESLPAHARRQPDARRRGSFIHDLRLALRSPIGVLLWLAFLVTAGLTMFYGIFGLYALEAFGFGPQEVGVLLMVMGLVSAVGQGVLSGPLTKRFGDVWVIKVMLLLSVFAFLLIAAANSFVTLSLTMGLFVLATALVIPAMTALTSQRAPLEQGITMGLSNSFMSLGRIAGPLLGGVAFELHILYPFFGGAAILLVGFGVTLFWIKPIPHDTADGGLNAASR